MIHRIKKYITNMLIAKRLLTDLRKYKNTAMISQVNRSSQLFTVLNYIYMVQHFLR
jgi:hypothetical protein